MVKTAAIDYGRLDEATLLERARQGERDAFRAIMTNCNQRLFRVARSIVGDDAEAEDVLQEAYTRAFTNLSAFRGESRLLTWLTTITLNEARTRLRRRRATVGLDAIEAVQKTGADIVHFPSPASDPECDAGRAEVRRLLEHAIDELPQWLRLVFIMREIEECTADETASALGLKPETVNTRLFRARKLLRQKLDQKLAAGLTGAFPFLGRRCSRITETVLSRLNEKYGSIR
jgi:RNA polymerase sigma-70 factor (ECF subfamily)